MRLLNPEGTGARCIAIWCLGFMSLIYQCAFAVTFTDVTAAAGISESHDVTSTSFQFKEWGYMTGGAVAEDFDGDGWIDVFVARTHPQRNLLYINDRDGSFTEAAVARGVDQSGIFMGAAAADYDNDGDVDIVVTAEAPNHLLLINDGTGNFTADQSMLAKPVLRATSPSWGDVNNDGLLDLVVGSWLGSSPDQMSVYLNQGSGQLSEFISIPNRHVFTPKLADLDNDRDQDIFIVADFGDSRYMLNDGNGIFSEGGTSDVENGMGGAIGDIDNDGDLDVFITSIRDFDSPEGNWGTTGNRLLRNDGAGSFTDITTAAGVRDGYWGWGAEMADFDNDGDLDIYHVNGWPEENFDSPGQFNEKPALLFENLGGNVFQEIAVASGAGDAGQGRSVSVFDYDNDGDLDIFIVNNSTLVDVGDGSYELQAGTLVLLRNDTINSNQWLNVELDGESQFHKHGIGSRVYVSAGGVTQMRELHASSGFNGHGTGRIGHFGLGASASADVEARWLNGDKTGLYGVSSGTNLVVDPPKAIVSSRVVQPGEEVTASVDLAAVGGDSAIWSIDGVEFPNPATTSFLTPGTYEFVVEVHDDAVPSAVIRTETLVVVVEGGSSDERSIAQLWNEQNLAAIRIDFPDPAVHSRNLFHTSIAMWDAWCAYGSGAEIGYLHREEQTDGDVVSARREAISYAAYRILKERYEGSVNGSTTIASINLLMQQLGYDPAVITTIGDTPAALGNRVAATVLGYYANDGSYDPASFLGEEYSPSNPPLPVDGSGTTMTFPNRWQPLLFEDATTQNGQVADVEQSIVGPNWGAVRPFALTVQGSNHLYFDPGTPPMLGGAGDAEFKAGNVVVIEHSSLLDPSLPETLDISPGAWGNHPLGETSGTGHPVNPVTGSPYVPQVVKHADFGRVLAEFWADGPDSETPPGHWNVLANELHDHPDFERKYRGQGSELERLEWDVKVYLALNGSLHDSAIAAWGCKRVYDYVRPISSIRYMAGLGQSSDSGSPSYHADGIPLVPGLIEVITAVTSLPGERHEHLASHVGEVAIYAWSSNPVQGLPGGVDWILAVDWMPYQRATFVTPAFPGYVSGHSTFSRAAAEVLTFMTGSAFFPGGIGSFTAVKDEFLHFEPGPSDDIILQWGTYYDAADQAGISRLYGGIHVPVDDGPGRIIGSQCGLGAVSLASKYFEGTILDEPFEAWVTIDGEDQVSVGWQGLRGFHYMVESAPDLTEFLPASPWMLAEDVVEWHSLNVSGSAGFFRVRRETVVPSN